jgi:hypothetical protein
VIIPAQSVSRMMVPDVAGPYAGEERVKTRLRLTQKFDLRLMDTELVRTRLLSHGA